MTQDTETIPNPDPSPFRQWGLWAVLFGALALALVFAQMVGPSFETKPSVGTQIGEIAGDIRRSAWRSFFGLPTPPPEPEPFSIFPYLAIAAPILGIIAVVLAVISGVLRENWRYTAYGLGLGIGAIVFQYVWWLVLIIAGVILLVSIIENIGDIFSF